jgi:hypothetical protein
LWRNDDDLLYTMMRWERSFHWCLSMFVQSLFCLKILISFMLLQLGSCHRFENDLCETFSLSDNSQTKFLLFWQIIHLSKTFLFFSSVAAGRQSKTLLLMFHRRVAMRPLQRARKKPNMTKMFLFLLFKSFFVRQCWTRKHSWILRFISFLTFIFYLFGGIES